MILALGSLHENARGHRFDSGLSPLKSNTFFGLVSFFFRREEREEKMKKLSGNAKRPARRLEREKREREEREGPGRIEWR